MCIIEMLFIALAMHYAFHYTEWAREEIRESQRNVGPFGALFMSKVGGGVVYLVSRAYDAS